MNEQETQAQGYMIDVLREHERLVELVMAIGDLFEHDQAEKRQINMFKVRRTIAARLRESIAARDVALLRLGFFGEEVAQDMRNYDGPPPRCIVHDREDCQDCYVTPLRPPLRLVRDD